MNTFFEAIVSNGIPSDVIYFLLSVSFVTMIVTFGRYVVGLKLMGMYVLVTMTYVLGFLIRDYSLLSILVAFITLAIVYAFSYFIKRLTVKLSLHSFARISLVVTLVSMLLLAILMVVGRFDKPIDLGKLDLMRAFPILLVVMLSEYFSSHQTQKGIKKSRTAFFNSLVLASITGGILSLNEVENFMLSQPYIIFTFMLLTILFGRYKGLRLAEVFRFKDIQYEEDESSE